MFFFAFCFVLNLRFLAFLAVVFFFMKTSCHTNEGAAVRLQGYQPKTFKPRPVVAESKDLREVEPQRREARRI
jgi:hypothetical protein